MFVSDFMQLNKFKAVFRSNYFLFSYSGFLKTSFKFISCF